MMGGVSSTRSGLIHSVAINGRFTGTRQPTGTQTVAFHLFNAMMKRQLPVSLTVFADSRLPGVSEWKSNPQVQWVEVPFQSWSRSQAQLWEQFVFPVLARRHGCRVAHHPINTSPLWSNGLKKVVTLHDLSGLLHPEWYTKGFRLFFQMFMLPGLRGADRVVTVSKHVQGDVLKYLKIGPGHLRVIYNGVKFDILPQTRSPQPSMNSALLCVGSLQPHKNLPRLIRVFQKLRSEGIVQELWVVGRAQSRYAKIPGVVELMQGEGVKVLGYLDEEALFKAYQSAQVFVYPSLEEGFGLPVLEALLAGALVVTSNTSSLPEVAGPSAILVNPESEESIEDGIRQCLRFNAEERERRREQGQSWAQEFSWDRAAQAYLELYSELLVSD